MDKLPSSYQISWPQIFDCSETKNMAKTTFWLWFAKPVFLIEVGCKPLVLFLNVVKTGEHLDQGSYDRVQRYHGKSSEWCCCEKCSGHICKDRLLHCWRWYTVGYFVWFSDQPRFQHIDLVLVQCFIKRIVTGIKLDCFQGLPYPYDKRPFTQYLWLNSRYFMKFVGYFL